MEKKAKITFLGVALALLVPSGAVAAIWASSEHWIPGTDEPELGTVLDAVMSFIKEKHPELAVYMDDLQWIGGRVTPEGLLGYETYVYTSNGWKVTIGYAVLPKTTYEVTASIELFNEIEWKGTVRDGIVSETSYDNESNSGDEITQEQAVEIAKQFILSGATFKWDGIPGSLQVVNVFNARTICGHEVSYLIELSFTCAHGGYGDRTGQPVTEALTDHVARIVVTRGQVIYAVIDEQWDELSQQPYQKPDPNVNETTVETGNQYLGSQ